MRILTLNGSDWQTTDDFYNAFFVAVAAPSWHGRNLDALHDSISTGGINEIELPYLIRITGVATMGTEARSMVERFNNLIHHLQAKGDSVAIELLN